MKVCCGQVRKCGSEGRDTHFIRQLVGVTVLNTGGVVRYSSCVFLIHCKNLKVYNAVIPEAKNPVSIGHPPRTPTSGLRSWMNEFTGVFVLHLPGMVLAQTSMPKTLIRNLLVTAEHARKFERITHNIARACSL